MSTSTSLHLSDQTPPPKAGLCTYPHRGPIAYVDLDGHLLTVNGTDPAQLLLIAEAFTDAARQLAQQLDVEAAREVNGTTDKTATAAHYAEQAQQAQAERRSRYDGEPAAVPA